MAEKNEEKKIINSKNLIKFVKNNDLKEIFKLLSKPIDFDEKILEKSEDSIFHIAVKNGNIKMFDYLCKSFPELLNKVVNNKIIVNENGIIKKSILQIFAEIGDIRLVNFLLSIDDIDYNREDLINYLIKGKIDKFEIKKIIDEFDIADGIDQKIINTILGLNSEYNKYTIFDYVINNDDIKGLRFLLRFYKDFDIYTNIIINTKQKGKKDIFKNIIDDFVFQSINEKDKNGNTLFHYAILKCDLETIIYLIGKGVKTNIENSRGLNPLGVLLSSKNLRQNYEEIVNLLLSENLLENIRNFQLYNNIVENERVERRLGITEASEDQDVLNTIEDLNTQQKNSKEQQNSQKGKDYIKKQILDSIKSFNNNSNNLATLYGQGLIYCMVDHIDDLEFDYTLDPIWKFFNNADNIIKNSKEIEKTVEEIYKLTEIYKPEIMETLKSLNNEDFNKCKKMFSINKVKEKMNKASNNLYKEVIGNFIEKAIIDTEYNNYLNKIESLFLNEDTLEINADNLMELVPFNENDEVDKEKLSNIVTIAKSILSEDKFNELLGVLERNFYYKEVEKDMKKAVEDISKITKKNIDKDFYNGFGDDLF